MPTLALAVVTLLSAAPAPGLEVQPKARAYTLETASVGGGAILRAGDHVDVVAVVPKDKEQVSVTLLQNVVVLANMSPAQGEPKQLSLLLIPEEAQLLALAASTGHLVLTLRNPTDRDVLEERGIATPSSLATGEFAPARKAGRK